MMSMLTAIMGSCMIIRQGIYISKKLPLVCIFVNILLKMNADL